MVALKAMKKSKFILGLGLTFLLWVPVTIQAQEEIDTLKEYWDVLYLDAGRHVPYLTENEKDLVLELNLVRTNPKQYAELFLKPLELRYKEKLFIYPDDPIPLQTEEGIRALLDCIKVLENTKPMGMLHPAEGLCNAAADHAKEQSKNGRLGHKGRRSSTPFTRMERYGKWGGMAAENIDYGNDKARWVVISLLIDDGVVHRGHRTNILLKEFGRVGVAFDSHPKYEFMCVMDFAGTYVEK